MTPPAPSKLRPSQAALVAVVAGAAVIRLVFGLHEDGIYWPDEIYQSLEPAHRLVYGYGLVAWEFVDGARNWAMPGLVAAVLWIARAFGADSPDGYLPVVRCVFVAIAAGTTWGVHRLARACGATPVTALAGAAAFAFAAPVVYFGHRAMSETASALPVVWGFAVLVGVVGRWGVGAGRASVAGRSGMARRNASHDARSSAAGSVAAPDEAAARNAPHDARPSATGNAAAPDDAAARNAPLDARASGAGSAAAPDQNDGVDSRRQIALVVIGASLLGIAVMLRLQNGIFCLGALGILAARRQWRTLALAFGVLVVWALLFGLLDKLTWGGWFHSAVKYLQFNLVEKKSEGWGTAPFGWYVAVLFRSMPLVTVLLGAGLALSAPRAPVLLVTCAVFFLLHGYMPHKELRFLLPMIPVACALAGVGFAYAAERFHPQAGLWAALALTLVAFVSGLRAGSLKMGQLGAYEKVRPFSSAWGDFADVNRLLRAASRRDDVCGLKVEAVHQAWTGGETYLHQPAPYYAHNGPPRQSGRFNYVITWARAAGGGEIVAQEGPVALVRLGDRCVPDPGFNWRLP